MGDLVSIEERYARACSARASWFVRATHAPAALALTGLAERRVWWRAQMISPVRFCRVSIQAAFALSTVRAWTSLYERGGMRDPKTPLLSGL